jgi:hypothetical protein
MDRDLRHTDPKEWAGGVNTPITEADKPHYTLSMPKSWNVGVRGTQVVEFGLTPASRARVHVEIGVDAADPFEQFLSRGAPEQRG